MTNYLADQARTQRRELEARGNEIISQAEAAGRNRLTDSEEREFSEITEKIGAIDERLAAFKEREEEEAAYRDAAERYGFNSSGGPITAGQQATSRTWLPGLAEYRDLRTEQRAVGTSGAFIPVKYTDVYFDMLRKRTAVLDAGPVLLPVHGAGSVKVPKVTTAIAIAGKAEAAALDASDPTLDVITLDPKKFGAYTLVNREAVEDSSPQLREVVANSLLRDTAVELDKQLIAGSGSGQNLTGLRNVSSATTGASTGANGASLTFTHLADTLGAAEAANVDPDRLAWFMHSRTWASVRKLLDSQNRPIVSIDPTQGVRPSLWGRPVYVSNNLSITETKGTSSDCSSIILADMSQVVVAVAREVELAVSEEFKFDTDQVALRVTCRYDIGVPHPAAVTITDGVRA